MRIIFKERNMKNLLLATIYGIAFISFSAQAQKVIQTTEPLTKAEIKAQMHQDKLEMKEMKKNYKEKMKADKEAYEEKKEADERTFKKEMRQKKKAYKHLKKEYEEMD